MSPPFENEPPDDDREPPGAHRTLVAFLAGMIGGGLALGMTIWWSADRTIRGFLAIGGAIGGAALGALVVSVLMHDPPRPIRPTSTCRSCGEPIAELVPRCPLCGEPVAKGE